MLLSSVVASGKAEWDRHSRWPCPWPCSTKSSGRDCADAHQTFHRCQSDGQRWEMSATQSNPQRYGDTSDTIKCYLDFNFMVPKRPILMALFTKYFNLFNFQTGMLVLYHILPWSLVYQIANCKFPIFSIREKNYFPYFDVTDYYIFTL